MDTLPVESAFLRARTTGDRWSETEHLLAYLADQVTFARREAQGEDSTWTPQPLPRPGDADERAEGQRLMHQIHDGLMAMMTGGEPGTGGAP